ncbi:carbohydrate-binding protein [Streptomyces sp. NBC_00536]|uniref:CBM35 domain-containing protein n=1 Tax=Streptomyces sp. NBC_00536 TaxID=2975769 RepID=UPI002E816DC8|nr:CBM35 domain-containing protein [Streptomyces sp. NBC_00536]WUC80394.1 carbohydrate-binding protein [Streptomyces sp. NBC_00536]
MTTPANHGSNGGANKPEDDDPFGYLYEDGQAAGATPPGQGGGYGYPGPAGGAQPGVPRTSYNQVRTVGDRTYGGQRGQVPYQQGPPQQGPGQQPAYPNGPAPQYQAQYQAPEALQAGGYGVPPQQQYTQAIPPQGGGHGGGNGGGSSRRGMLIAAGAVVAAVAIGIGAAVIWGNDNKDQNKADGKDKGTTQSQSQQPPSSTSPSGSASPSAGPALPKADATGSGFALAGGASVQNAVPGAKSSTGQYVGGFNKPGASLTWSLDVPKAGNYKLKMTYGVPGKDGTTTLTVNGEAQTRPINMKNWANAKPGEWDKGWTNTYSLVDLKAGANTVKISCEAGNQCDVLIDQLWLEAS